VAKVQIVEEKFGKEIKTLKKSNRNTEDEEWSIN